MGLSREGVIEKALALLDEAGLDGLTVRALARSLGVENPALYWHFQGKQELLNRMAERILSEAFQGFDAGTGRWEDALREFARRFRQALLSRRDATRVVAGADLSENPLQPATDRLAGSLAQSGCKPGVARTGVIALLNYTLGASFEQQQDPRIDDDLRQLGFDRSLQLIIAGIRAEGFASRSRKGAAGPRKPRKARR